MNISHPQSFSTLSICKPSSITNYQDSPKCLNILVGKWWWLQILLRQLLTAWSWSINYPRYWGSILWVFMVNCDNYASCDMLRTFSPWLPIQLTKINWSNLHWKSKCQLSKNKPENATKIMLKPRIHRS